MNEADRTRKIEEYGTGYELLVAALAEIPEAARDFKPSPTDWSVNEIIVHLGDSESMAALRLRKLVVEPGSELMAYNESKWAEVLAYRNQAAEDSLEIIRLARQTTYRLLKSLPPAVLGNAVKHPEHEEPYTFEFWLDTYARHIPDHIRQMKDAHESWKEQSRLKGGGG
jgi:hypothetical protein